MLFTSFNFLVFFCITVIIYYILPHKFRWILLLLASLTFYLFSIPFHAIVLIGSILLNYGFSIWIDHSEIKTRRKQVLIFGIIINLFLLAVFRYAGTLYGLIPGHFLYSPTGDSVVRTILVPLGISFYTFTNISYLVEVKRNKVPAERHLGYFACYVSFFPKLIQGPIEQPQNFLPQLRTEHNFDYSGVTNGIRLMLWGFFKKLVIADSWSGIVNAVYDHNLNWKGPMLVFATLLFAFQIYMDFSGYIDIARGAAKVLGFNLSRNFNNPYLSISIKDFWTRWHITLSQWLRDYIFLPIAYFLSAKMKKGKYGGIPTERYIYSIAISVTFLLCGLWHGVGWNFIAWGGLFAIYLVIGSLTEKSKKRFYKKIGIMKFRQAYNALQITITFLLVCFAWIFFRAPDFQTSFQLVSHLSSHWDLNSIKNILHSLKLIIGQQGLSIPEFGFLLLMIPCVEFFESYFQRNTLENAFFNLPLPLRWTIYYLIVLLICYFGKSETNTFIYFQF